jgi:hypothetical protein
MSVWIKWSGGERPVVPGAFIELELRDGWTCTEKRPEFLQWKHINSSSDIVAYRFVNEENPLIETVSTTNPKQLHGQSSLPLSAFSPLATAYGSLGKLNGALKYGTSNFVATPVIASIYVDAIRRHLDKWMAGQENDPVDNVPHFSAVLANVDILLCARAAGTLIDDRPMIKGYYEEIEKLTPMVKALHELHKDRNPHHYLLSELEKPDGTE